MNRWRRGSPISGKMVATVIRRDLRLETIRRAAGVRLIIDNQAQTSIRRPAPYLWTSGGNEPRLPVVSRSAKRIFPREPVSPRFRAEFHWRGFRPSGLDQLQSRTSSAPHTSRTFEPPLPQGRESLTNSPNASEVLACRQIRLDGISLPQQSVFGAQAWPAYDRFRLEQARSLS